MSGEKTEQPTHKKLQDARKKGQVAKSKDFTQTALILALFGYLIAAAGMLAHSLAELLVLPMGLINQPFRVALEPVVSQVTHNAVMIVLPFLGIVIGVGIFAEMLQVGVLLSFEALKPSGKKLNVAANAKNMVSKKNLVEFLKNILKVAVLTAILYKVVRSEMAHLLELPKAGVAGVGMAITALLKVLIINVAMVYLVIALADFVYQRLAYKKQLMMSKDEVKREYKESEGDPHIKGARKHLHQELMMSGNMEKTRKASVVVTNPTHIAIALYYDDDKTPLPMVLAKGTDLVAKRMIEIAREEGIPVMQNIPLARALHAHAQLEQYVPSDLLEPVAEVLRAVRKVAQGLPPGET
ncbi:type III secretion system export apparatus subunit SctU [Peristeroidobacter soli]|uniref:type III secretion system export apparatus subunit SctU n=1 Tax=Peristeroidobacter soli TaxID=2497877 RepID=UPI00101D12AF|nr:type III secretion system export apparatus subunit SctU [Peristeroidobacter soli]